MVKTVEEATTEYATGKKMKHIESQTQRNCVTWFRLQYPQYLCFSIPNGGARNAREAGIMKGEGVLAGVSDLIIVAKNRILFVEMKTEKGKQRETQKRFQDKVESLGFVYFICRSFDDFMKQIEDYLGNS
jgi:hypothetical protein